MSVFKNAIYRDQYLNFASRNLQKPAIKYPFVKSLANFDIEDFGQFVVDGIPVSGNLEHLLKDENTDIFKQYEFKPNKKHYDVSFEYLAQSLPRAKIGLQGVYHYLHKYWDKIFSNDISTKKPGKNRMDVLDAVYTCGLISSAHTPHDVLQRAKDLSATVNKHYVPVTNYLQELWKLKAQGKSKKTIRGITLCNNEKRLIEELPSKDRYIHKREKVYVYKGYLIIVPQAQLYCYIFSPQDLDRIERVVRGFAIARIIPQMAYAYEQHQIDQFLQAIISYQNNVRTIFSKVGYANAQKVCRFFDVVFHLKFAELSADISREAYNLQKEKIQKERLHLIDDAEKYLRSIKDLPVHIQLEILCQYKCFPQPDFDIFGAAQRQSVLYANRQAITKDTLNDNILKDILKYHKWLLLVTYYRKNQKCPGELRAGCLVKEWHYAYPHNNPSTIPFRDIEDIDFHGDFIWQDRSTDVLDLVKDKAICATSIDKCKNQNEYSKLPAQERNQLLDWVGRTESPNLHTLQTDHTSCFHDVKAEDKPEAKKPHGRWFFEAHTDMRLLISNYEESVAYYAKDVPGSFNGISIHDKIRKMSEVVAHTDPNTGLTDLMFSFDIDKFSPSLQVAVHRGLDKTWSEAFGKPHLQHMSSILTDGKIHYIKGNIHHTFNKVGADFEGFFGRKLTIYHCAVMGYCVRRLKELNFLKAGGYFACLIDDGLLRLKLPTAKYDDAVKAIKVFVDTIYKAACLHISWDKTFLSSHFCIFLNEVYYDGRRVPLFLKACLRITSKSESPIVNMVDELQMCESTTRGAIAAGAPLVLAYGLYSWTFVDCVLKWGRFPAHRSFSESAVAWFFTPISLGGFGMANALQMSGSVGTNQLTECLSTLYAFGSVVKAYRPIINRCVSQVMTRKTECEIARDPLLVRTREKHLKMNRTTHAVTKALRKVVQSPVLDALLKSVEGTCTTLSEILLSAGSVLPVEVISSLNECEPSHALKQFTIKFTKAATVMKLLPASVVRRITYANISEAEIVCSKLTK